MPGTSADQEVGHVRTPTLEHLTVANSKTRNQTVTLDHYTPKQKIKHQRETVDMDR